MHNSNLDELSRLLTHCPSCIYSDDSQVLVLFLDFCSTANTLQLSDKFLPPVQKPIVLNKYWKTASDNKISNVLPMCRINLLSLIVSTVLY